MSKLTNAFQVKDESGNMTACCGFDGSFWGKDIKVGGDSPDNGKSVVPTPATPLVSGIVSAGKLTGTWVYSDYVAWLQERKANSFDIGNFIVQPSMDTLGIIIGFNFTSPNILFVLTSDGIKQIEYDISSGNIAFENPKTITSLALSVPETPLQDTYAASKRYVDSQINTALSSLSDGDEIIYGNDIIYGTT